MRPAKKRKSPAHRSSCGDGVKTKSGCEDTILGQILPPRGGVSNHFSENSSDLGHYFLPSSPEKSRFTLWLDAADGGRPADPSRGQTPVHFLLSGIILFAGWRFALYM